jgi:hypothetical protein
MISTTTSGGKTKAGLTNEQILGLQQQFKQIYPLLDDQSKQSVEALLTKVRDTGVFEVRDLDTRIEELTQVLRGKEKEVYEGTLKDFFTGTKDFEGPTPSEDAFGSFDKLFAEGDLDRVTKIVDMATKSGDKDVINGIKATSSRFVKNRLLQSVNRPGGVPAVNIDAIAEFLDPNSNLAQITKKTLGEDFYTEYSKIAKVAQENWNVVGRTQDKLLDTTSPQSQGAQGLNSIITWFFGVLNPTAATIRTVSSGFMKENSISPAIRDIMDRALADPDYFLQVAKRIQNKQLNAKTREIIGAYLRKALTRGVLYQDKPATEEQTEEVFGNEVQ